MIMRNIQWRQNQDKSWTGTDQDGNTFRQPANQETTLCILEDGRKGFDWTPMGAYKSANNHKKNKL